MSVFDGFMNKAKNATQTAGKMANELVEITKIKKAIFDLDQEISRAYEEIGRMVFETYLEKATYSTDVVNAKCELINNKIAEKKDLEKKIHSIKKVKMCKECKELNPIDNSFCAKCGAKLENIIEDDDAVIMEEVVSEETAAPDNENE